ncbi:MAG: hypothetical protein R2877_07790 [Bdellovibrionota bacterium]
MAISLVPYQSSELHLSRYPFFGASTSEIAGTWFKNSDIIYNINVPSVQNPIDQIEFTRLGSDGIKVRWFTNLDPRGKVYFWIGGEKIDFDKIEGTDSNAIRKECISISPIDLNLTDMNHLEGMKNGNSKQFHERKVPVNTTKMIELFGFQRHQRPTRTSGDERHSAHIVCA